MASSQGSEHMSLYTSYLPRSREAKSPVVPFRGIHSFSHSLQRRLGFSGVPMTTIAALLG